MAIIAYSVALRSSAGSVDVIGATALGLALFCPLDLGEFAHRFQGVTIASSVIRALIVYWTGRVAPTFDAMIMLALMTAALAAVIPDASGVAVAGLGAVLALRGAPHGGIDRSGTCSASAHIKLVLAWPSLRCER